MVRKSRSMREATDLTQAGAYADIVAPPRKEGDPTGQTTMLEGQAESVSAPQQSEIINQARPVIQGQPQPDIFSTPTEFPNEPGYIPEQTDIAVPANQTQITKQIILEKFPELAYRFR